MVVIPGEDTGLLRLVRSDQFGGIMSEKKKLNRRSFMARIAGGAVIAGGATALVTGKAEAQNQTGRTDSDSGNNADRAGYGRTGMTDSDSGNGADRASYGRGGGGNRTGWTDTDSGGNADNAGNGRGATRSNPTGLTDGDSGSAADRGNYGRGQRRNW
jgi:hypothetical protein